MKDPHLHLYPKVPLRAAAASSAQEMKPAVDYIAAADTLDAVDTSSTRSFARFPSLNATLCSSCLLRSKQAAGSLYWESGESRQKGKK